MNIYLLFFFNASEWFFTFLIGGIIFLAVTISAWFIIKRYVKPETAEQRRETVALLFQFLAGTAFLLGVYFTWQQLVNSRDTLITTQHGQITERFTRAIDQLGKEDEEGGAQGSKANGGYQKNLAIRLGGIYALERIAKNYQPDHPSVMEVLTAFVRQRSAWVEEQGEKDVVQPDIRPDIQAILTVIGRRYLTYNQGEAQRLDLSGTDLRWAVLNRANFDGIDFTSSHFENAQLKGAKLNWAILTDADFTDAIMDGAQLQGADLRGAVFRNANVGGVNFKDAKLFGADLTDAVGLTQEQLNSAQTDVQTKVNLSAGRKP